MKVQQSMQIATRPEKVWSLLTNGDKIRQWCISMKQFEIVGGDVLQEGAKISIRDQINGKAIIVEAKVTEWTDNERIAFEMTSGGGAKTYFHRWLIEPSAYGTRMTWEAQIDPETSLVDVILGLFRANPLEENIKKMLNKLREMAETSASGSRSAA